MRRGYLRPPREPAGAHSSGGRQVAPGDMAALWNLAAFLHRSDEDAAGAERCYQQMLSRNRGDEDALAGYVALLREQGRAEQAERLLEGVLDWDPRHAGALCAAAELARARNDTGRAERLLGAAVRAAPRDAGALCALGLLLEGERGDWEAAERLYARAIAARPGHAVAAHAYATLLAERRGDLARADEMFQRAVGGTPRVPEILFAYAVFLDQRMGEPVGAEVGGTLAPRRPRRLARRPPGGPGCARGRLWRRRAGAWRLPRSERRGGWAPMTLATKGMPWVCCVSG